MTNPRARVPGPGVTPLPFGLLSVATVIASDGEPTETAPQEWRNGIEFESDGPQSGHPDVSATVDHACAELDPEDPDDAPSPKSGPHGVPFLDFPPVTLYAVHSCSTGGRTTDADRARAGRLLTNGEAWALEQVVESGGTVIGLDSSLDHSLVADAVLAPVGSLLPSSVAASFALAETFGATLFGMGFVIHAPRGAVSIADAQGVTFTRQGARLETILGTPVAAGAGYQGLPPAALDAEGAPDVPATYGWLYVTGPVVVYRGAVDLPDRVSTVRRDVNTSWVVAERTYSFGWEFGVIAIPFPRTDLFVFPEEG